MKIIEKYEKWLCLVCITISVGACYPNKDLELLSITIDPQQGHPVRLSEIAEKIDPIELETTDNSLIKDIRNVDTLAGYYLIHDTHHGTLIFDKRGKFVRKIGKYGKGPGELVPSSGFKVEKNGKIRLSSYSGPVIYDIGGNFIEQQKKKKYGTAAFSISSYVFNDTVYKIDHYFKQNNNRHLQDTYYSRYDSNATIIDSMFVHRHESNFLGYNINFEKIFQSQGKIYMFYSRSTSPNRTFDTLFVVNNHHITPFAQIKLIARTNMENKYNYLQQMFMTNRHLIIAHGYRKMEGVVIPERDLSYFCYDFRTRKGINSPHGFIDDIHQNGKSVIIEPIENHNMFFYIKENDYSEELKTELNPTLYIGTFKK